MQLIVRRLPIDHALTAANIDAQANQLSRYHLIKDLALKGPEQISCFLQLIQRSSGVTSSLQLSLITVLFEDDGVSVFHGGFPLFDFIGIHTPAYDSYGVMFSTYLHDLNREDIGLNRLPYAHSKASRLTRLLMDSLYLPTSINGASPPFPGRRPVFLFPPSKNQSQTASASATDLYMSRLGYRVASLREKHNSIDLRVFYHETEGPLFDPGLIDPLILAVGQACVAMAQESPYLSPGCLKPFDRLSFNVDVQARQARIAQLWLTAHLMRFTDE